MEAVSTRTEGLCLLIGCFLMFITMVMHPVGGDMDHILDIWELAVISHAIALASLPFLGLGFWGLYQRLRPADFLAKVGLSFMLTGLISVLMAGAMNGLVYPIFARMMSGAVESEMTSAEVVGLFGHAFNRAFDYIFMGCVCISMILWSVAMIRTKQFPAWLGHLGWILGIVAVLMWISGFVFVDLHGFRIFIAGWFAWLVVTGYFLRKPSEGTSSPITPAI